MPTKHSTNSGKSNSSTKVTIDRSSITGRFVTPGYARQHPKTTEQEKYKRK